MIASMSVTTVPPKESQWQALWDFAVHCVVGTALFVVIAVPAISLNLLVQWIELRGATTIFIITGLHVAEYALFAVDLLLFIWFVLRAGWHTARSL